MSKFNQEAGDAVVERLLDLGYDDEESAEEAMRTFKRTIGFKDRTYPFTAVTLMELFDEDAPMNEAHYEGDLGTVDEDYPWMEEARLYLGLHEEDDNDELLNYLKSDGDTLGDPSIHPWCGDFVATVIQTVLPEEEIPGNPYLAYNWGQEFGVPLDDPCYGAVVDFWRGSPTSWKGHVGFIVGWDDDYIYCLGGNQSDSVTISKISRDRIRAILWPYTTDQDPGDIDFNAANEPEADYYGLSFNEA